MIASIDVKTDSHTCLVDITRRVQEVVLKAGVGESLCTVFVPHTTAGVTINENADPDVQSDMIAALDKLVPWRDDYSHAEGNSAAHLKASMMGFSQQILVEGGDLLLGTWQGIYLFEFDGPRTRRVLVQVLADGDRQ